MIDTKKRTQIIVFCISIGLLALFVLFPVKYDSNKTKYFSEYKVSFEKVNKYIESYYDGKKTNEEVTVAFSSDKFGLISSLFDDGEYFDLDSEMSEALTNTKKAFKYDFSLISVTENRISYGGEGHEMYVYMDKGWFPTYFYSKDDGCRFTCYSLGNNWYYFILKQR